jgi:hypothetical protein
MLIVHLSNEQMNDIYRHTRAQKRERVKESELEVDNRSTNGNSSLPSGNCRWTSCSFCQCWKCPFSPSNEQRSIDVILVDCLLKLNDTHKRTSSLTVFAHALAHMPARSLARLIHFRHGMNLSARPFINCNRRDSFVISFLIGELIAI